MNRDVRTVATVAGPGMAIDAWQTSRPGRPITCVAAASHSRGHHTRAEGSDGHGSGEPPEEGHRETPPGADVQGGGECRRFRRPSRRVGRGARRDHDDELACAGTGRRRTAPRRGRPSRKPKGTEKGRSNGPSAHPFERQELTIAGADRTLARLAKEQGQWSTRSALSTIGARSRNGFLLTATPS